MGRLAEKHTSSAYDTYGRRISETDQLGRTRWFEYDESGRLIAVILPAVPDPANSNALTHPRYEYAYDAMGNHVLIRDNVKHLSDAGVPSDDPMDIDRTAARETVFTFDEQGRQLTRTLPEGQIEEKRYNEELGHLEVEISFEGVVTQYVYASATGSGERLIAKRFFATETDYDNYVGDPETYSPDEITAYAYDAFGRPVEIIQDTDGDLVTTADQRVTGYQYDADGRLTQVASDEGTIDYAYDALGRLTETATNNTITQYGYDALGRLTSVTTIKRFGDTLVTPEVTAYHFDLLGQLDLVVSPNGVVADYDFDEMGRVISIIHFDDYDADLVRDTTIAPEPIIAQFDYTYNDAGQRLSAVENFDTDSDGDFDITHEFDWDYDALDRLIEEIHDGTGTGSGDDYTTTYSFDLVGNRVTMTTDSSDTAKDRTVTYTYDDNDRLLTETSDAVTGDDTHTIYSWGNATGTVSGTATQQTGKKVWESLDTSGDVLETVTYAYNLQGRLAQATIVKGGDTTVLEYSYDDAGIRVGQTETVNAGTPVVTQYLVDHNNHTGYQQVLEEFIDAVLAKSYTIGLDVLAQTNADTTPDTYQFLYDAHGSTRALLDTLAIIAQTYAYDAYGNALGFDSAATLTSLLYSGEQFDQKLAMQYLRARYYDANTGRFNRVDPFQGIQLHPQSLHKYTYAHDNPVNLSDPTGEFALLYQLITIGIGVLFHTIITAPAFRLWSYLTDNPIRVNAALEGDHIHLAHLADDAYRKFDSKQKYTQGWERIDPQKTLSPGSFMGDNGFHAALYKKGTRYALVYRGTEDTIDWLHNVTQVLAAQASSQYRAAVQLAEGVGRSVGTANLTIVGHSLGGGLASAASLRIGVPAVTFNAAGLNPETLSWAKAQGIFGSQDRITAYQVAGELLSTLQIWTWLPDAIGRKYQLAAPYGITDAFKLHSMTSVLAAFLESSND